MRTHVQRWVRGGPHFQGALASRLPIHSLYSVHYFSYTHYITWRSGYLKEDSISAVGVSVLRWSGSLFQGCLTVTPQVLLWQAPAEDHTMDAALLQVLANLSGLALPRSLNPVLTSNTLPRLFLAREYIVSIPSSLSVALSDRWGSLCWLCLCAW